VGVRRTVATFRQRLACAAPPGSTGDGTNAMYADEDAHAHIHRDARVTCITHTNTHIHMHTPTDLPASVRGRTLTRRAATDPHERPSACTHTSRSIPCVCERVPPQEDAAPSCCWGRARGGSSGAAHARRRRECAGGHFRVRRPVAISGNVRRAPCSRNRPGRDRRNADLDACTHKDAHTCTPHE
jgi:hypothetical protein